MHTLCRLAGSWAEHLVAIETDFLARLKKKHPELEIEAVKPAPPTNSVVVADSIKAGQRWEYTTHKPAIKGGVSIGTTDDLGARAVENPFHVKHLHATVLHQMGLDPNKLAYFYGGLDQKLVGVEHADPIREII